jgi:thioesterase domain-containing protein
MTGDPVDARFRLQDRILADIPLARHIGVRVLAGGEDSVVLAAALGSNSNHKGTAFGGSLFSLAVLAGWGLLSVKLEHAGVAGEIVIQETQVNYLRPVTGDFTARAVAPDAIEFERLLRTLQRRGRGRIGLKCFVEQSSAVAVEFNGTFAVVGGGAATS